MEDAPPILGVDEDSPYGVYVIECEPKRVGDAPLLYVGQSKWTPERRLEHHLSGDSFQSSYIVYGRARRLLPKFYADLPGVGTRERAERLEEALSRHLASVGFPVHSDKLEVAERGIQGSAQPSLPEDWIPAVCEAVRVSIPPPIYCVDQEKVAALERLHGLAERMPADGDWPLPRKAAVLREDRDALNEAQSEAKAATSSLRAISRLLRMTTNWPETAIEGSVVTFRFLDKDSDRIVRIALGRNRLDDPSLMVIKRDAPIYVALRGCLSGEQSEVAIDGVGIRPIEVISVE